MPQYDMNRRTFLESTAASGLAAAALTRSARAAAVAQNEAIRVGIVGPGGRGIGLLKDCIEHGKSYNARLTAVCDIWNMRRERAVTTVKDAYGDEPKVYRNYEQLLADDDIDALIIATADHQHAKMLKMAIEAGKDVYCEKPMGNVLSETNDAFRAVIDSDRIVQLGTQRRSYPKYRAAMEAVQQGRVGEIAKIDVIWNVYSPYRWARTKDDLNSVKKSDIDWQAFLLGKPDRPYDPRIFRSFRLFKEFSSGIIDQWMSHGIDVVHMLSGELYPRSVLAQGGIYHWRDYRENPDTINVSLEYGEGEKQFLATYATCLVNGAGKSTRVYGTHGTLEAEDDWRISGDGSKRPDALKQAEPIEEAKGTLHHMANWLDAVRTRNASSLYCNADAGYGHSIACILATDSLWSGRRMVFDSATREIVAG
jgi:predicted dehydrogenase